MKPKPNLFIGSSAEQIEIASAIQVNLERVCNPTVWSQGIFELMSNTLDDLMATLERSDFGVFVLTPDDIVRLRDKDYEATRDNVLFELGLFLGKLGKSRAFVVLPRQRDDFRLPTDLLGANPAEYDGTREDIEAALGPACTKIAKRIKDQGVRSNRIALEQREIRTVFCLSTKRYEEQGIEQDIKILKDAFPDRVTEKRCIDLEGFRQVFMSSRIDLLHIVVQIDPDTGAFLFPRKAIPPTDHEIVDQLPLDGFVKLIEMSKASLIVLATCHAVYPASKLVRVTNVIGAAGDILTPQIVSWSQWFYDSLKSGHPLSRSFEIARVSSGANLSLFLEKDFVIASSGTEGSADTTVARGSRS